VNATLLCNNVALTRGGAICIDQSDSDSVVQLHNCTAQHNEVLGVGAGGALDIRQSTAVISDFVALNNSAHFGGALCIQNSAFVRVTRSRFEANRAIDVSELSPRSQAAQGGAVAVRRSGDAVFEQVRFERNAASQGGAAWISLGASLTLRNCTMHANDAHGDDGNDNGGGGGGGNGGGGSSSRSPDVASGFSGNGGAVYTSGDLVVEGTGTLLLVTRVVLVVLVAMYCCC
jgi:predicted outer membrane repeat protein